MSTGKKYPCIPARIAAWVCAVLLTIVLACTLLGMTAARMLSSEESHVRISTDRQVIAGQMEKIAGVIRDLAEEYGFSAEPVIDAVSREEITELNTQMAGWWTRIATEGILEDVPSWPADSLIPVIMETMDPGKAPGDPYEKAAEAAGEIEKTVREAAMPVRTSVISFGVRYLNRRIDLPGAVRTASGLPLLGGAVCLLLAGLIALLTAGKVRTSLKYYGAAFGGAGISAAFCMILAGTAGIQEMISRASEGLSRQTGLAVRGMVLEAGRYILLVLAAGIFCLIMYTRPAKDGNHRGGKYAEEPNSTPDPVTENP